MLLTLNTARLWTAVLTLVLALGAFSVIGTLDAATTPALALTSAL
jgi:hypothetical protein